jgi:uncharacterized membrane protein
MTKWLAAYATTALAMLALDLLWIGWLARPLYLQGIGHLMAAQPRLAGAAAFYLLYPAGLLVFALLPQAGAMGLGRAAGSAALFGFFAYATYDLTNLSTLKDWPLGLSLLDMAWGTALSTVAATAGKLALDRMAPT